MSPNQTDEALTDLLQSTYVHTISLRSDATDIIFSLLVFMQLLFEGGIYFLGKPADINDG